ncbi:xylitol oxidase [Allocatelliglobosispora scoriae]|uniref:Xylitol oxidase n=1 Tax=Allocatelliglobosispora scoriae TaxID=643052 RepID=A0A841BN66_9ACTN|nr:FAD-binding protein [Allocatelliglobosispora scoriae]MBB5868260.1 xylitol oxidase [Allocatelliglobosispora scoriae]
MREPLINWAGNVTYRAARVHRPTSLDELRRVVAGAERLRAFGTGHSFNRLADSDAEMVSVAGLPGGIELDTAGGAVRVPAGVRYGELATWLDAAGFALRNLASLPHISVAGAVATGTHGSGVGNGNLATAVTGIELVRADGELATLRRGDDGFAGAVVSLGALGVVTALTLEIVPTYQVRQLVYEDLPQAAFVENFDEVMSAAYSVSAFTSWSGPVIDQVWRKHVDVPEIEESWWGGHPAAEARHPIATVAADACTEQFGVPGPWHERLPHFRLEFTPSAGDELQTEYFVDRADAATALRALDGCRELIAPILQVSEIRTIAADDLWLSPCEGRDSVAIHFTWVRDAAAVEAVLPVLEEVLAPLAARPHWGKVFTMAPEVVRERYRRITDFDALVRDLDPAGKFRNEFLDRYLG